MSYASVFHIPATPIILRTPFEPAGYFTRRAYTSTHTWPSSYQNVFEDLQIVRATLWQCQACVPGFFQSDYGQTSCIACVPGKYQGDSASTGCIDCTAGKYDEDSDPTTPCILCPTGYDSISAQYECTEQLCMGGLTLPHSPSVCAGGTGAECVFECDMGYSAVRPRVCMPDRNFLGGMCTPNSCSLGLQVLNSSAFCQGVTGDQCQFTCDCGFHPGSDAHICGTDGSFSGGMCVSCPEGAVSRGVSCSVCADGYEPSQTRCECLPCEAGYAGVGGVCNLCEPATEPNAGRTECIGCDVGMHSSNGIMCVACNATTYTLDHVDCLLANDGMVPATDGTLPSTI